MTSVFEEKNISKAIIQVNRLPHQIFYQKYFDLILI